MADARGAKEGSKKFRARQNNSTEEISSPKMAADTSEPRLLDAQEVSAAMDSQSRGSQRNKERSWKKKKPVSQPKASVVTPQVLGAYSGDTSTIEEEDGDAPAQGVGTSAVTEMAANVRWIQGWASKQQKVSDQLLMKQARLENMMANLLRNQGLEQSRSPGGPMIGSTQSMPQPSSMTLGPFQQDVTEASEFDLNSDDQSVNSDPDVPLKAAATQHRDSEKSLGRLHSVFVQAIWNLPNSEAHKDHRQWHWVYFEHIVEHWAFEYVSAAIILAHSIFIGAYVEYIASADYDGHTAFSVGNSCFVLIFCIEVGLKLGAERQEFFQGPEWRWNIFDIILMSMVLIEVPLGLILAGKDKAQKKKMKTVLKIAEMVRTARILRIFRFLKFSRTLRVILSKIFTSIQSLGWIMVLVCIQTYVVSVCLTQGANDYLQGNHQDANYSLSFDESRVHKVVGSIPKSIYTCFASISGGMLWGEVAEAVYHTGGFYVLVLVAFIAFSIFAVLNVMTGIFVDDTIRADADLILEHEQQLRAAQAKHLRKMFAHMDESKDGIITQEEFLKFAHDEALRVYLDALGIKPDEAGTLFQLLDEDSSGEILVDEFIMGCMHLRGEATSLDMKTLLYENRRLRHKVFDFIHYTEDELAKIIKNVRCLSKAVCVVHQLVGESKKMTSQVLSVPPDSGGTPQGGTGSSEGPDMNASTTWKKKGKKKQQDGQSAETA